MPKVTAPSRTMSNGDTVTEFIDTVNTTSVTYDFPVSQDKIIARNRGTGSIQVTAAGITQTLLAGEYKEFTGEINSFAVVSTSGVQPFGAVATKASASTTSAEEPALTDAFGAFEKTLKTRIISDFQPGHGWTAGVVDTTNVRYGTQGLKLTSVNSVNSEMDKIKDLKLKNKNIFISLYVDNIVNLSQAAIILQIAGSWAGKSISVGYDATTMRTGWNQMVFGGASLSLAGGATIDDLDNVTGVRLRAKSKAGTTVNVTFDMLQAIDNPLQKAVFVIGFDDGHETVYLNARPTLTKYGYRATNYIIPSKVGQATYMTLANIKELQALGWDIGSHTYNHVDLSTLGTAPEVFKEVEDSYEWLIANGFGKGMQHFAYPYGGHNQMVEDEVRKFHGTARTTIGGYETIPTWNPMRLRTLNMDGSLPFSQYQANIDKAMDSKQVLIFLFHAIAPTGSTYNTPQALFDQIIDYLYQKGAYVVTMSELSMMMADYSTFYKTERKANKVGKDDIEITDTTKGIILKDRTTGSRYRLKVDNGVVGAELVP